MYTFAKQSLTKLQQLILLLLIFRDHIHIIRWSNILHSLIDWMDENETIGPTKYYCQWWSSSNPGVDRVGVYSFWRENHRDHPLLLLLHQQSPLFAFNIAITTTLVSCFFTWTIESVLAWVSNQCTFNRVPLQTRHPPHTCLSLSLSPSVGPSMCDRWPYQLLLDIYIIWWITLITVCLYLIVCVQHSYNCTVSVPFPFS